MWDLRDGLKTNFTYTFIALKSLRLLQSNSSITTSRFGMFANNTYIEGKIDVSGQGCLAGDGIARGRPLSDTCSGSGGASGGKGGRGRNVKDNIDINDDRCA